MSAPAEDGSTPAEAFDIGFKLRQRLNEMDVQKKTTQAKINILSEQLQRMYARAPKKTRDTQGQMDDKIAKLEYQRTTVSLSLSDEKQLLRQIDMINRSKKNLVESQHHEHYIQEKKGEIGILRDNLRSLIAQIAELQSALSKVELAKRLDCNVNELQTIVLNCPADKIGQIIGKNGSSLKQLEGRTGVQIDVDKHGSKIHLQGSEAALNAAVREVENITLAVDVSVELTSAIVNYLIAKRSAILNKIQQAHPSVYFDVSRNSGTLRLRGLPDNVELAKIDIKTLDVKTTTRALESKETGLVVGKGGVTITKLTDAHAVSLNVLDTSDGSGGSTLEVTGPRSNVDNAMDEIEDILYNNAEVEEFIYVEPMQRNMFLANSAAVLKKTQKEISSEMGKTGGGVLLVFERNDGEERLSKSDPSKLIMKASRSIIDRAKEIIMEKITAFDATVSSITVDPSMIPAIIGKGGATIKELRKEGVEIEVYRDSGVIKIQSEDDEAKTNVAEAIEKILAENQSLKVIVEKSAIGLMFGDIGKAMRTKVMDELGVKVVIDSSDQFVTLRGTVEKNEEAAIIIREFIVKNFTAEFNVPAEDSQMLLHGGADNFLTKLGATHDVKASLRFARHVVSIRGLEEHVGAAMVELKRYIFGGDGLMVSKLRIPESSLGLIIGKGGAHITKLEKTYEGISLDVLKGSNQISMRGPEDMVKGCRSHLVILLATTKVNDSIRITLEQHDLLVKPENMKRITDGMGVEVVLSHSSVKLKGISTDVKGVNALITELLTGKFEASVEVSASQLAIVREAAKDPSQFSRIQDSTKATLAVNTSASCIVLSGKRASVKKAKNQVMVMLESLCPGQFLRVKLPKAVLKAVAQPASLGKISADTGATLSLDRELSCILIRSTNPDEVQAAENNLKPTISKCEKLNIVIRLEPSDSWLIPRIIGKGGANIQNIQTDVGCKVDVDRSDFTISIVGETEEISSRGKAAVDNIILQCRKECVFMDIPDSAFPSFIGKGGANIQLLADKSRAKIERMKKDPSRLQVQGTEDSVKIAVALISNWIRSWESKHVGQSVSVPQSIITLLMGKNAFTLNAIQQETGTKIDVNRRDCIVTVREGNGGSQSKAIQKISDIIEAEDDKRATAAQAEINKAENAKTMEIQRKDMERKSQEEKVKGKSEKGNNKPMQKPVFPAHTPKSNGSRSERKANIKSNSNIPDKQVNGKKGGTKVNGSTSKGTQASQSLYNLLVSETDQEKPDNCESSTAGITAAANGEDVSKKDVHSNKTKKVYKSASGFSVRV